MSRYNANDARRNIFIPEIGSYLVICNYIKEENIIRELIEFTEEENRSFSRILGNDDDIMRHEQVYEIIGELDQISSDYIDNIAEKLFVQQGLKRSLS